jgi:hypothetical protein
MYVSGIFFILIGYVRYFMLICWGLVCFLFGWWGNCGQENYFLFELVLERLVDLIIIYFIIYFIELKLE